MLTITSGIITYILYGAVIVLSIYNLYKCRSDTRFPQYVRLSVHLYVRKVGTLKVALETSSSMVCLNRKGSWGNKHGCKM